MKRLISAHDVERAAEEGTDLCVDGNTIVTPQAADVARELGVTLRHGEAAPAGPACAAAPHAEAPHAEGCVHAEGHPCGGEGHDEPEPALSAQEMERLIRAALDRGIWTEDQVGSLLSSGGCEEGHVRPDLTLVPVGVSGRHIHLSQEHLEALFGAGCELECVKELSQPGQFAARQTVTLVGPKGVIERVRVLGPVRSQTQVEVLVGDTFRLGVPACVRMSGNLAGTPGITLVGPAGTVVLSEGVIVAARHIHMSCEEAAERGLHDGQVVSVEVDGGRGGVLGNVVVRANDSGALDCHLDTEEANALGLKNGSTVRVVA